MLCRWNSLNKGSKCIRCGFSLPRDYSEAPVCNCRTLTSSKQRPPGLGDCTEQLLASIGVTKERYVAAKELFGLAPTCGCEDRKAWLNRVSEWCGSSWPRHLV